MKIEIHENIKKSKLLDELYKIIHFKNITIKEKLDYELIQKICLFNLEDEDNFEKHISSFKPDENILEKLSEFAENNDNIEIKARIFDILQLNKKDIYKNSLNSHKYYIQFVYPQFRLNCYICRKNRQL